MKKLLSALVALALTSCTTLSADGSFTPNSTVQSLTDRASQALIVAWRGFDAILTAVDGLRAAGVIRDGSPKALRVADALDRARNALNAATEAVRIGNAGGFTGAMSQAQLAFTDARAAIGGN
jgi:hypothetical protein